MSKMKDLHIDIQVETAKLVEKLNVISKHAKALAAELEELDKD